MKLLRSYPLLVFLLVLLSITGVCLSQGNLGLLLFASVLAVMSWYVTEGPRGRTLPGWLSNLAVLGVLGYLFIDWMNHPDALLDVLGRFTVWLTVVKLFERDTPRDHAQLLMLSVLLILTGSLQSNDLIFGLILLLYIVLGLYVLLLHQLYHAYEDVAGRDQVSAPTGSGRRGGRTRLRPVTGPGITAQFRRLTVIAGLIGLSISAGVFVFFPRGIGQDAFVSFPQIPSDRRSGFTDQVDLLGTSRINLSQRPVMRVAVTDRQGRTTRLTEPLYLRGAVLNAYDGRGRWRPRFTEEAPGVKLALDEDAARNLTPDTDWNDLISPDAPVLTLDVRLIRPSDRLFAPLTPVRIETPAPNEVAFQPDTHILRFEGRPSRYRYEVTVLPEAPPVVMRALLPPGFREPPVSSATANERIHVLALRILDEMGLPTEPPRRLRFRRADRYDWNQVVADAFVRFLTSDAFTYTLDLSDVRLPQRNGRDIDPVEHFLLTSQRGHCEYFAAAMVALCHNVGVDARMVAGYATTNYDEERSSYVVLEANAHAWVEVRTGPRTWTRYDPTPASVIDDAVLPTNNPGNPIGEIYRWADTSWNTSIAEFDRQAQFHLANSFEEAWGTRLRVAAGAVREWMADVNRFFRLGPAGYIWLGIVGLAITIALVAVVRLTQRALRLRETLRIRSLPRAEQRRMRRQLGFYLDMLDLLRRARIRKPQWQPPFAFAEELTNRDPRTGAIVQRIIELYYAGRYRHTPLSRAEREEAVRGVEALADHLGLRYRRHG